MELCRIFNKYDIFLSLTDEKAKNGYKACKIKLCSRFLFRNEIWYCAILHSISSSQIPSVTSQALHKVHFSSSIPHVFRFLRQHHR